MDGRQAIAAVIERWRAAFADTDADRLKTFWAHDHDGLTYLPTEARVPMTGFAEICAYYDAICAMLTLREWRVWDVLIDCPVPDIACVRMLMDMTYEAHAAGHPEGEHYWQGRAFVVLRRSGGEWKFIHYEDSTLMDYMPPLVQAVQKPVLEFALSLIREGNTDDAQTAIRALMEPIPTAALTHANTRPQTDPRMGEGQPTAQ